MSEFLHTNSIAMLVDVGILPRETRPTFEEAQADYVRRVKWWEESTDRWEAYLRARKALEALPDPLTRSLLALHAPEGPEGRPTCGGCDAEGWEREAPGWPCRTVQMIAGHYGIPIPSCDVAAPGPRPVYQSPEDWTPPRPIRDLFPSAFVTGDFITYFARDASASTADGPPRSER